MNRVKRAAIAACALLAATTMSHAQQIEWSQTLNLAKGLNLPQGVKGDILGIELGDSYAEARARLEAIQRETKARERDKILTETTREFYLQRPGGNITASYVGGLLLKLRKDFNPENIEVIFSGPSSGHQVLGVQRYIEYARQQDQPRISELIAGLKAKYKAEPRRYVLGGQPYYVLQFNDGQPFNPPRADYNTCPQQAFTHMGQFNPAYLQEVNSDGTCDVVLRVNIKPGMSEDHISSVTFWLSDNERTKKNIGADFAYFNAYIQKLQQGSGGAAPKL